MLLFEKEFLKELVAVREEPCLSLYQPTHRMHPDNQQDPIRFGNLVKKLSASLLEKYSGETAAELVRPFEELVADRNFWNHTPDGIVVFRSPKIFRAYGLQRRVPELAIVAPTFHTKPLQRYVQATDRYQVLGMSLHEVFFYEGNRDVLDKVPLPGEVPDNIEKALGSELTEPHITVASYGGKTAQGANMVHGHGGKKDEMDVDTERFFRTVDRAVQEHCSQPSGLPLILAALPEHHNVFQKISRNPFLQKEGIKINPESQSDEAVRKLAWEVWEPGWRKKVEGLAGEFNQARANGLGTAVIKEVARAAVEGRIGKLLIEENKIVPGKITDDLGKITQDDLANPEVDDLLDDLGARVLQQGGEVFILPAQQMPDQTGAAAIYRY